MSESVNELVRYEGGGVRGISTEPNVEFIPNFLTLLRSITPRETYKYVIPKSYKELGSYEAHYIFATIYQMRGDMNQLDSLCEQWGLVVEELLPYAEEVWAAPLQKLLDHIGEDTDDCGSRAEVLDCEVCIESGSD